MMLFKQDFCSRGLWVYHPTALSSSQIISLFSFAYKHDQPMWVHPHLTRCDVYITEIQPCMCTEVKERRVIIFTTNGQMSVFYTQKVIYILKVNINLLKLL